MPSPPRLSCAPPGAHGPLLAADADGETAFKASPLHSTPETPFPLLLVRAGAGDGDGAAASAAVASADWWLRVEAETVLALSVISSVRDDVGEDEPSCWQ